MELLDINFSLIKIDYSLIESQRYSLKSDIPNSFIGICAATELGFKPLAFRQWHSHYIQCLPVARIVE